MSLAFWREARKSKGLTPEEALKTVKADYTYFGVLLVKIGVAQTAGFQVLSTQQQIH